MTCRRMPGGSYIPWVEPRVFGLGVVQRPEVPAKIGRIMAESFAQETTESAQSVRVGRHRIAAGRDRNRPETGAN